MEEARLATSHGNLPHVKPVSYILDENTILVATDYDTRTYKNLKENPKAAISIDVYKSDGHKAVLVQGTVELVDGGEEFERIYSLFYKKFRWVRDEPWKEGEAPFLKCIPKKIKSWGLK